jgi:hypothetical protein
MSVTGRSAMPTNLQSRSQYLVLAEFCRKAIRALSGYVDGSAKFPTEDLQRTVDALQSIRQGDTYQFGQRPASALGSYEQLRTLEQVFRNPEELGKSLALTTSLLEDKSPQDVTKVKEVVRLFADLQAKALWNFEQPAPVPAPDLDELCRAFETA